VKKEQGSLKDNQSSFSASLGRELKPEGAMSTVNVSSVSDNVKATMSGNLSTTAQLVHEDVRIQRSVSPKRFSAGDVFLACGITSKPRRLPCARSAHQDRNHFA
jgi:hypothetical protein